MYYQPKIQSNLQWHLDNERVPGQFVLMLEPPVPEFDLDAEPVPDGQIDFERIFRFDLTETDAIVVEGGP